MSFPNLPNDSSSESEKFYLKPHILKRITDCPGCCVLECMKMNNRYVYVCPDCGATKESFQSAWGRATLRKKYAPLRNTRVEECRFGQLIVIQLDGPCQTCTYRHALEFEEARRKSCQKSMTPAPSVS